MKTCGIFDMLKRGKLTGQGQQMSTSETAYIRSNLEIAPGIWRIPTFSGRVRLDD